VEIIYFCLAIALLIFAASAVSWRKQAKEYESRKNALHEKERQFSEFEDYRLKAEAKLQRDSATAMRDIEQQRIKAKQDVDFKVQALTRLSAQKNQGFPYLAEAWNEYLGLHDKQAEYWLRKKSHPAKTAADTIREYSKERRDALQQAKIFEYKLRLYESLFPWITEFSEEGIDDALIRVGTESEPQSDDPGQQWVSEGEWTALSPSERSQFALNRYVARPKSNWEIGRDYERFVGYMYEKDGCNVQYMGAIEGFDDLGRDLVIHQGKTTKIVQCKYWAEFKQIREKHIFQLYGTCVEYALRARFGEKYERCDLFGQQNLLEGISPELFTSTKLSERALGFARALGVSVFESYGLRPYPMIKCNVSRNGGERIYHLPFDQQYDKVQIEIARGECYVATVAEAEALGFRRAYRWRPSNVGESKKP
jgi:hypothetical protein